MEEKGKEIKDIHIFSVYYTVYNHLTLSLLSLLCIAGEASCTIEHLHLTLMNTAITTTVSRCYY